MEDRNTFRELAFRYFEGRANSEDEQALYDFLAQDPARLGELKGWEREWSLSAAASPVTAREWERLRLRLALRAEQPRRSDAQPRRSAVQPPRHVTHALRLLRRSATVAATILLGVCTLAGLWTIVSQIAPANYYTIEVPLGEKSRVVLGDGTVVWLNAGSTLRCSDRFGRFSRRVELSGEGYFEVAKRLGSAFKVDAGAYQVRVTGTRFDVCAYPEDDLVTTTLAEGSVELLRGRQRIGMNPGESVQFDRRNDTFLRSLVDPSQAYSWMENRIEFDNITLRTLVAKLSRQYDVRIFLESERVKLRRFHISLRNDETIRDVLDALKKIIPIRYEYRGDDIYITEIKN